MSHYRNFNRNRNRQDIGNRSIWSYGLFSKLRDPLTLNLRLPTGTSSTPSVPSVPSAAHPSKPRIPGTSSRSPSPLAATRHRKLALQTVPTAKSGFDTDFDAD
ncbi:hypothetical protein N7462_004617 [Penicillium macrosclerotiorum]|uniref:uncharacterized protein n=1 Tax=Penicillium macrosclerotiorum TaxID=303699 RepID=UPI002546F28C|nr:uncharacterized protein N7462_004617 [Penicillium macrosclerotiorum]KAJ5690225.1 hypothetical protein N7462_004617 [Penicillium macrosclerotiorum]